MTLERKKILRYGLALDAVLLVTGIALIFPDIPAFLITLLFAAAVAIGAWRGGWGPALAGLMFACLSTLVFFQAAASAGMLAMLVVSSLAAASIGAAAQRRSAGSEPNIPVAASEQHLDRADDYVPESATPSVVPAAPATPLVLRSLRAADSSGGEESKRLLEERLAANRTTIEETLSQRVERESHGDHLLFERLATERLAAEREEAERAFHEGLTVERAAIQRRLVEQLAIERAAMEREAAVQLAEERIAAQESIERQLESERATLRGQIPTPALPSDGSDRGPATALESSGLPPDSDRSSKAGRNATSSGLTTQTPAPPFVADSQTLMTARGPIPKRPVSKLPTRSSPAGIFSSLWSGASGLFGRRVSTSAGVSLRPGDTDEIAQVVQQLEHRPRAGARRSAVPVPTRDPDAPDLPSGGDAPGATATDPRRPGSFEICCFSCAELFDAAHAEWCSCPGRDQTLVCPECGNCFCRAPSLYKERFWRDAPPILFERRSKPSS